MARYPTYDEYRDKPKKGIAKCDELLKRTPKDIQLLALKSQLFIELGETAKSQATLDQLLAIQPSPRDFSEISLIEDAVVEHLQSNAFPQPLSTGPEMAKLWDAAYKAGTTTNYKLDLQSLRFSRAIFDNRIQDAQQALIQLKLMAPKNRVFYMAHAIVTQMLSIDSEDLSSRLALMLAKKAVSEKFDEVANLDCRVPGQIFAVQQKKEELKASAAEKSVNVAMTQHDSIFKNIQLPGGISTKATEYKDLAAKGDKWESPVFSIGSASETSNLPRVSKPTRKPHSTAAGGLRDAGHTSGSGAGILGGNTGSVNKSSEYSNGGAAGLGGASGLAGANSGLAGQNSAGFANQVDNAFGVNPNSVENNATGHILPGQAPTTADQGQHTLLRDNNPVYRGAV